MRQKPKPILLVRMTSDTSDDKFHRAKEYLEGHQLNEEYHVLVFIDDKNDGESTVQIMRNPNS